jgi:hypothetical protein
MLKPLAMMSRVKMRPPTPLSRVKIRMARVAVVVAGVAVVVVGRKKAPLAPTSRRTKQWTQQPTLPKRPQNRLKWLPKMRLLKSRVAGPAAPRLLTSLRSSKHR